ncbi:hypothetical protein TBKG_00821 [Mycobacterium tuberculosis '98-R604 INH-RIF-EM']|nr:hypothetical protein TBKG_00821 [Mycobacterium tuberculosis '98-R604 INH-RIF-EM']
MAAQPRRSGQQLGFHCERAVDLQRLPVAGCQGEPMLVGSRTDQRILDGSAGDFGRCEFG